MVKRLKTSQTSFREAFAHFLDEKREADADVDAAVADILKDVRTRGDMAVIEYTGRFDQMKLTPGTLRIDEEDIAAAESACPREAVKALKTAARRIADFHARQVPEDEEYIDENGVRLGYKWTAIEGVGVYVPGGLASYPSSVLMNAVPAKVASVDRVVMCVPTPKGEINPLVLAAAKIAGVDEVYRIGGAQAIAALAFGTETIRPVDKITGPGNAYVASAKKQVFGHVGIDMIAGPSEILVVADNGNPPEWIAADLMSQAEHDTSAQSILITDDAAFALKVEEAVEDVLAQSPRADIARQSWEDHGAIIVVTRMDEAVALVDQIAPEHLELAVEQPHALAERIRNAGAIFLGRHTPEAIGDYVAGPNHVLPTARSARFSSGLGVLDFMKRSTLMACDAESLKAIGPAAVTLAEQEGLDAHALSVTVRLKSDK